MLSLILPFRQGRYLLIQTECVSSHWDALCFAKAYEKNTRMCQKEPNPESLLSDFRDFSSFQELGNTANGIFYSSQYWENRFSLISCFPNVGKVDFQRFLIFPRGGKPIFCWFSFIVPYESFFLPFFINCTPYLSDFSRKCMLRQDLNAFGGYCMSRSASRR